MWFAVAQRFSKLGLLGLNHEPRSGRPRLFVDKVHDIVGLYLNPPERALVILAESG